MKKEIEELKKELEDLADKRFILDMKDHWEREDYEWDKCLLRSINAIIEELKGFGIEINYKHGYQIEYKEKKEGNK